MTRPHFASIVVLSLATLLLASVASAGPIGDPSQYRPTLSVAIDGQSYPVDVKYIPDDKVAGRGVFAIGAEGEGHQIDIPGEARVILGGGLDPDPSMIFGSAVFDFGAPSSFSFMFTMPLLPLVSNPSLVSDSFSGSVTNGAAAGGVTITALPPPPGIPTDGAPDELQVYTLSDDGGTTWKNVGLDAGPSLFIPLGPNASGVYPSSNQGPIATIAGGPWTHMRADINFMLSGGGDAFTFNGAKVLVPEPGTVLLSLLAIAGCWCYRRAR